MITAQGLQQTQANIQTFMTGKAKSKPITEVEHQSETEEKEPMNSFFGNVLKLVGVKEGGKDGRKGRKKK